MITEQQADTMIALLTEIRDELQRPRLAVERHNLESRQRIAEEQAARDAAAPPRPPTIWTRSKPLI